MLIYGHRGARGEAPENTLAGFRHAVAAGAIAVELDLRLSRDGRLMVIHDATVTRTTGKRGSVARLDAATMARMDARRDTPHCEHAQPIPVIEDVLDACPEIRHFQLELKSPPRGLLIPTAEAVVALHRTRGLRQRATVTSFDGSLLAALRARDADIRLGFIADRARPDPIPAATSLRAELLVLHWPLASAARITAAHERGLCVTAWTVNDAATLRQLARAGVDSVVTDFPSRMLPVAAALCETS